MGSSYENYPLYTVNLNVRLLTAHVMWNDDLWTCFWALLRYDPLVVVRVNTHTVTLEVKCILAKLGMPEFVLVEVRPTPNTSVDNMGKTLTSRHLMCVCVCVCVWCGVCVCVWCVCVCVCVWCVCVCGVCVCTIIEVAKIPQTDTKKNWATTFNFCGLSFWQPLDCRAAGWPTATDVDIIVVCLW